MKTHRPARVGELIKREVGEMLLRQQIRDLRVGSGMVSVTDVEVSGDLRHAKIFVSIYGTEEAQRSAMAALSEAEGFVRQEIGRRIRLRYTPEVAFVQDRSLERGARLSRLIDQLRTEQERKAPSDGGDPSEP
jgi:ribosome-binding factor A